MSFVRSSCPRAAATTLLLALSVFRCQSQPQRAENFSTREAVGKIGPERYYTPANQILTPAGTQVELPGMRPQALALSPDGKLLVTAGKIHELVVVEPGTGKILQRVALPSDRDKDPAPDSVSEEILKPDT